MSWIFCVNKINFRHIIAVQITFYENYFHSSNKHSHDTSIGTIVPPLAYLSSPVSLFFDLVSGKTVYNVKGKKYL